MEYTPGKRGRKAFLTYQDKLDASYLWKKQNPERCKAYRRQALLMRCIRERRMPKQATITKYGFTDEELQYCVDP